MRNRSNANHSKSQQPPKQARPVGGHRPPVTARGRAVVEDARRRRAEGRF